MAHQLVCNKLNFSHHKLYFSQCAPVISTRSKTLRTAIVCSNVSNGSFHHIVNEIIRGAGNVGAVLLPVIEQSVFPIIKPLTNYAIDLAKELSFDAWRKVLKPYQSAVHYSTVHYSTLAVLILFACNVPLSIAISVTFSYLREVFKALSLDMSKGFVMRVCSNLKLRAKNVQYVSVSSKGLPTNGDMRFRNITTPSNQTSVEAWSVLNNFEVKSADMLHGNFFLSTSVSVCLMLLKGDYSFTERLLLSYKPDETHRKYSEATVSCPIDEGLWWIILMHAHCKCKKDFSLLKRSSIRKTLKHIIRMLLLRNYFNLPTILCEDACSSSMSRRMGIHGYPIEIQVLWFYALSCAKNLISKSSVLAIPKIEKKIESLRLHLCECYWLQADDLKNSKACSSMADFAPEWVYGFLKTGGYFIRNVSPSRMDFRWFTLANCLAVLSSLATEAQTGNIMKSVEARWTDLIGEMPMKACYPALEGGEWRVITGFDPDTTPWSSYNAGTWPILIWLFTAACVKAGRSEMARRAIELAKKKLSTDGWPEYYNGKTVLSVSAKVQNISSSVACLIANQLLRKQEDVSIFYI